MYDPTTLTNVAHAWESQESERSFFFLYLNLHIPIFFFFDHVTKKKKKKTRRKLLELEVTMHTQPIGNCPKTPMSLKYMPR